MERSVSSEPTSNVLHGDTVAALCGLEDAGLH